MSWDVWGPPVVVLLLALVVALAALLFFQARGSASPMPAADRVRELAARKEILLDELRELEADRHKLDPDTLAAQREALIASAADVLREADAPAAPEPARATAPRSRTAIAGWLVGAVAFFALLGLGLSKFSSPRKDMGDEAGAPMAAPAGPSPEALAAQATLAQDPNDLAALNTMTHEALRTRDVQSAMSWLDRARAIDPNDAEVQTHLAVLQIAVGMGDRAATSLDKALASKPDLGEAHVWKGVVALQKGDQTAAKASFDRALAIANTPPDLKAMTAEIEQQMAAGNIPAAGSSAAPAPAEPPAAAGPPKVSGTVSLGGAAAPAGGTLFVIARRAKEAVGPPVAVTRMPTPAFPATFALGEANMMLGGTWPDDVYLEARIDMDGNVMSKDDIVAQSDVVGPIHMGATDAALVLAAK